MSTSHLARGRNSNQPRDQYNRLSSANRSSQASEPSIAGYDAASQGGSGGGGGQPAYEEVAISTHASQSATYADIENDSSGGYAVYVAQ